MPEATDNQTAPEGAQNANAPEAQTQAATPDAANKLAELEATVSKLLKHKEALEADLHKYRKRNEEEMEKAKAAGDYAKLLEAERERAAALEAQAKALEQEATIGRSIVQRAQKEVEKAKADTNLPHYVRKAIAGLSPVDALEILTEYRAAQNTPPPAATPIGVAPAGSAAPKGLEGMTEAEILNAPPDKLDELLGRKKSGAYSLMSAFFKT